MEAIDQYNPIGENEIQRLVNLLRIWRSEGHLQVDEAFREDDLSTILNKIELASLKQPKQTIKEVEYGIEVKALKASAYNLIGVIENKQWERLDSKAWDVKNALSRFPSSPESNV